MSGLSVPHPMCEEMRSRALHSLRILESLPKDSGVAFLVFEAVGEYIRAVTIDEVSDQRAVELVQALRKIDITTARAVGLSLLKDLIHMQVGEIDGTEEKEAEFLQTLKELDRIVSAWSGLSHWNEIRHAAVSGGPLKPMELVLSDLIEKLLHRAQTEIQSHREFRLPDDLATRFLFNTRLFSVYVKPALA